MPTKKAPTTLRLLRGSYAGPGCPDESARTTTHKSASCAGWPYDSTHPALPGDLLEIFDEGQVARLLATRNFELASSPPEAP